MLKWLRFIGLLGVVLWCGNLASAQTPSPVQTNILTLQELAQSTGKNGQPAYIAVDGVVYDVTNVPEWQGGRHNGYEAGRDLTNEIKNASPHGVAKLQGVPVVGTLAGTGTITNRPAQSSRVSDRNSWNRDIIGFLGWYNAVLAGLAAALFVLRRLNKRLYANKNALIRQIVSPLSKMHPYIGMTMIFTVGIHGQLALGTLLRFQTGPLNLYIVVIMMLVALIGKKYRVKNWLKLHRSLAVLLAVAILTHIALGNI